MSTSDAERAAFEAHYAKIWKERTHKRESLEELRAVLVTMRDDDGYNNGAGEHPAFINNLWEGWQAHAALPIDFKQATDQGGWQLVPKEPTPEIIAAAAMAVWPTASAEDIALARKAAPIVLMGMDLAGGFTVDTFAASLATMAPAYRAMLAAAPTLLGVADGDAVGGKSGGAGCK